MLEMVDDITGEMPFASLQKRVSEYLHDIVRQVLKPGRGPVATWPTLYSLRHQLLADAKRTLPQPNAAAPQAPAVDTRQRARNREPHRPVHAAQASRHRTSATEGKSVSVRVVRGGGRVFRKTTILT